MKLSGPAENTIQETRVSNSLYYPRKIILKYIGKEKTPKKLYT